VGHRDRGTQLESLILYVSPIILNLYLRWDTGTQGHTSNPLFCLSLHAYSIPFQGRTQGHRDTTWITYTLCVSIHTPSLFEVGHRDTGTHLKSAVLTVFPFILNLYSRWDTGTQGHNLNPLFCLSLHSYSISIRGGTQGQRDTTRITYTVCLSIYTQSVFEVGHRDTGTHFKSSVLSVSPFILNLYSRWDTGTEGHNSNHLYSMSLHSYSISIRGGTQGHRDTTQIHCSVCLSMHTQSLFKVGHRDTGTQLESLIPYVSSFILHLYSRWDTGTQGHT
jgi:hypothetical protein